MSVVSNPLVTGAFSCKLTRLIRSTWKSLQLEFRLRDLSRFFPLLASPASRQCFLSDL